MAEATMISDCEIAELHWMAGMFEGEGSIRINTPTKRNHGSLLVDLANTDESIVRRFQAAWGGTIAAYPGVGNRKPYWRWRAASTQAQDFLLAMWVCFRTDKYKARAVCGLDFQAQKTRNSKINRTAEYRAEQEAFYSQMARLNLRGRPNANQHRRAR